MWFISRFLQIRLGNGSCDQISASSNGPKRAKSRDKNAPPHGRRQEVYLLVSTLWLNSVKLKGVSSRFYNKTYEDKWYIKIIIVYAFRNITHILLKTRSLFYSSCSFCFFCLRSTNAIERRHCLLASVSIASVLSEHHLFVYVRHIWNAMVWGAPSSRNKGIKRLVHQQIYSIICI